MTTDTIHDVANLTPVHKDTDAAEVALAAYDELFSLLQRLEPEQWSPRTECPAWDVSAMVGHMIGAAKGNASVPRGIVQAVRGKLAAKHHAGNMLDATNARQVTDHAHLSPAERLRELRDVHRSAVAGRMGTPGLVRRMKIPMDQSGSTAAGTPDQIRFDRLVDVIYTRDVWLHSVDIERTDGDGLLRTRLVF
jgi:uncharacterized protein (TIGR03083 family)